MKLLASLAFTIISVLSVPAVADTVSWHGYLSQGITQSVDSEFMTDDGDITAELTELGLNGRYEYDQRLAIVGQVVYLDGANRYTQGGRLDYLFVDITLPEMASWSGHLHLGRFKNQHWLYSATRDVPHTRATAVLPQSVYYDGFRDIALGSDGALLNMNRLTETGSWEINWSYGRSSISREQTKAYLGVDARGQAKQDFVHQFSMYWQPPSMNWRFGVSLLDSDFRYEPAPVDNLFKGESEIFRTMVSMEYYSENWELSAELIRERQRDTGAFAPNYINSRISEGGYVQLRYLFNDQLSGLIMRDTYDLNRNDRDGEQLMAQTGGMVPAYFGYMDTTTVGVRWDMAPNWRLQAEHHWVRGGARVKGLFDPRTQLSTHPEWRMWAVQLMYWF